MLSRLSIRDIVLIDRLDIDFADGLAVLTGETGAGKSILLDSFALALGARGDQTLVRQGQDQGQVIAAFELAADHPAHALLADSGIALEDELILRRVQFGDGRTRAFVNDQPVSVQVMKQLGEMLVEIHGQHDDRALVDAATHRRLLDAFAGLDKDVIKLALLWEARRDAEAAVEQHRADVDRARREADWLRHAVDELGKLAPQAGEETQLAERRTAMMQVEKVAEDLREAHDIVGGKKSPVSSIAAALRRLERRQPQAPALIEPVVKSLDSALNGMEEARAHLEAALRAADYDPDEMERGEERLFALRAAARKYNVPVDDLAALAAQYRSDIALIDAGEEKLVALEETARAAEAAYVKAAEALSKARAKAGAALDKAVNGELAPLKLERARFMTEIESDPKAAGPHGIDRVEFWVQTNPGTRPGPLMKVASGGELARFLLALKVVLADRGSAPTLVFDEIDTGDFLPPTMSCASR
ncbi:MAG TPA: DNA repair protein RecN, partial [Pseudolabrys sp.]|nr:DNA repair protein RecN [Pseudolabrys sp.]